MYYMCANFRFFGAPHAIVNAIFWNSGVLIFGTLFPINYTFGL